jgi:predicted ATPase/class 3 adenylate cyclase
VASSGTVTFLFTDVEGSTRLWQRDERAMRAAIARHDELLTAAVIEHGGRVFSTMGDGLAAAFGSAAAAVAAALAARRAVGAEAWPTEAPLRVRMGLHTGEAELRDDDYFGTAVNRAARLMAVAHGGQVLCSQATAALVDAEVELIDLGEHRLRDLDRPVRVFQVGGGEFESLRSLNALPGNLPFLTTSFVGRGAELAAVAADLAAHRLVTLTGVGGVGKTRLAVQVAAELLPDFADGAWLCELAAASTEEALGPVVTAALGVLQRPQMTLEESIVDFLRTRQVLLVLDNCEHLLDGAAELAEAILAGAPSVRVLATSREGLGIPAEHVRPLRSLAVATGDPRTSDAAVLFGERARAVDPDFTLDGPSGATVVEICRRLDGIPLAIELAAARVAAMAPAEISGHLDERFRLLTGGRRGRVERHQTLRAAIEWSYSLLTEAERTVFDRLGVFPASFDEAAAVAICGGDGTERWDGVERWDVIDALGSLVAKSMVGAERSGDATRYQLLETLRHFARDHIDADGDIDGLRRRHARHYAELAAEAGAALMGPDELVWRPRVAAELDNFRAGTVWAFDAADVDDVALGVGIVDGLMSEAFQQSSFAIQSWADPALPRVDQLTIAQRGAVLAAAATNAWMTGDLERGESLGGRAIAEWAASPVALSAAMVPATYGPSSFVNAGHAIGELQSAMRRLETEEASDWIMCRLHTTLAWLAGSAGEPSVAREAAEQSLATGRRSGSPTPLALGLATFARWGGATDDEALAAAAEAIRLIEGGAGDVVYTSALQTAAMLHLQFGDPAAAAREARTATETDARNGTRMWLANDLYVAAQVLATDSGALAAAAALCGALDGPVFAEYPMYFLAPDRTFGTPRQHGVAELQLELGDEAFAEAYQAGTEMTYDDIIEFAVTQLRRLVTNP